MLPQEKMSVETLVEQLRLLGNNRQAMVASMEAKAPKNAIGEIIRVVHRVEKPR